MPSYVITGASRGIGLEFVRQLSKDSSNIVFGLIRNKTSATELLNFASSHGNAHVLLADITNLPALKAAAAEVATVTGGTLDYLINNAALVSPQRQRYTLDSYPDDEQHLLEQDIMDGVGTNVIGTIHTINAFLPLLKATAQNSTARVITLSSGVGDPDAILAMGLAQLAPYGISKAAVNMAVAKYAARFQNENFVFLAISPGLVNTTTRPPTPDELEGFQAMVQQFKKAYPSWDGQPITPESSVKLMLDVITKTEPKDSGAFVSHFGNKQWL